MTGKRLDYIYPTYINSSYKSTSKNKKTKHQAEELHMDFLKRKSRWPSDTQKDTQHHKHQGNVNQNHSKVSPHISEWLLSKRRQITNVGKDVEKWEHFTLLVGM